MSDSSSMMMVMMMGMMGSCVLSVVGGLGGWYLVDPTLGGLLEDLGADDTPPVETPPGDASTTSGAIPLDQKVYIHGILENCDGNASHTLLYAGDDKVDVNCERPDSTKDNYLWTISAKKSDKWTYYTIKNAGKSKFLSVADNKLALDGKETLWRLKAQTDDPNAFFLSSKEQNKAITFQGESCKDVGGRRVQVADVGEGDMKAQGKNSRFKIRLGKQGWKGTGAKCS
jgi:hypothetical protein